MVAGDNPGRGQHEPVGVSDGQHVGCFRLLSTLVGDRLTAFLGRGVAAVQIDVMGVDLLADAAETALEHPL